MRTEISWRRVQQAVARDCGDLGLKLLSLMAVDREPIGRGKEVVRISHNAKRGANVTPNEAVEKIENDNFVFPNLLNDWLTLYPEIVAWVSRAAA